MIATFCLMTTSCDLLNLKDDEDLTAEDAKIEIRTAADDIMVTMSEMMETPAMSSLAYLAKLMGVEIEELKSSNGFDPGNKTNSLLLPGMMTAPMSLNKNMARFTKVYRAMTLSNILQHEKSDDEYGGVYTFNFNTNEFDLTNSNVSYLEYRFPSDETAFNSQNNNAVLNISNIEIVEIEDDESDVQEVPTKFDAFERVNNQEVMTISYRIGLSNDNVPNNANIQVSMNPYSMSFVLNGSNRNYIVAMNLKHGQSEIMGLDLDMRYTADMESFEKLDGYVNIVPLRFTGSIKPSEIELCEMNLNCMNKNINLEVWQTELDQRIGKLEFRMLYDDYYEEEIPILALVYEDGTFEYLEDLFGDVEEDW